MSTIAAIVWVWITCTRCDGTGTYRNFGVCFRCGSNPCPGKIRIRQDSLDQQRADQAATAAASQNYRAQRRVAWAEAVAAIDWTDSTPCRYRTHGPGCVCIDGQVPDLARNPQLDQFTD